MFLDVSQLFLNLQDACVIFSDGCRVGAFSAKLRLLGSLQFFTAFQRLLLVKFYFCLDTVAVVIQFLFQPELLLFVTFLAYLKTMRTISLQLLYLFLAKRQSMSRIVLFHPDFNHTLFTPIVRLLLPWGGLCHGVLDECGKLKLFGFLQTLSVCYLTQALVVLFLQSLRLLCQFLV